MRRFNLCSYCFFVALVAACGSTDSQPIPDQGVPIITLTHDELVDACARIGSCGFTRARLADCVDDFHRIRVGLGQKHLYSALYSCVNTAKGDCAAVRKCVGFGEKPVECDGTYEASCDGELAKRCDLLAGWVQQLDCAAGGLRCGVKQAGTTMDAICGGGPCDSATYHGGCDEKKRALRCVGGAVEIDDCPEQSLHCRDDKAAVCEGTGRSCFPADSQCDAKTNTLLDCVEGYLMHRDCSKVFGSKVCRVGGTLCDGTGTECTVGDFDSCEGDDLMACVDGYRRRIECRALGFLGCTPTKYGANCKATPVY